METGPRRADARRARRRSGIGTIPGHPSRARRERHGGVQRRFGEYLASHGYVVLSAPSRGFDALDDRLSGGAFYESQARDLEYLIAYASRFKFADIDRIGVIGFSRGGSAAVLLAARNPTIDAADVHREDERCVVRHLHLGIASADAGLDSLTKQCSVAGVIVEDHRVLLDRQDHLRRRDSVDSDDSSEQPEPLGGVTRGGLREQQRTHEKRARMICHEPDIVATRIDPVTLLVDRQRNCTRLHFINEIVRSVTNSRQS